MKRLKCTIAIDLIQSVSSRVCGSSKRLLIFISCRKVSAFYEINSELICYTTQL